MGSLNKTIALRFLTCIFLISLMSCSVPEKELLKPVAIKQIKVSGEIGRRIDRTMKNNILKIDIENQFLEHFRHPADTPKVRDGFCGIGMLLDAMVKFAAYSQDSAIVNLSNYVIAELLKTQDTDGYLGIYSRKMRFTNWDTHEGAYIITALTNAYLYLNHQTSLDAAVKLADYMIQNQVPYICGLEQSLLFLYQATGNQKYLDYCTKNLGLSTFKGGSEHHSTHAYGYIARSYAQLLLNQVKPDSSLVFRSKGMIEYMNTFHGMDITGTIGAWEHWNANQEGISAWGETCATAYEIRMLDKLLQLERNALYGDMMERIIFNALFAAQSPDGRHLRYFTPYEDQRVYYPDDYFCCPNNFRRIVAELPEFIYYTYGNGLYVNLYSESQAQLTIGKEVVTVEQKTDYPSSGKVRLIVSADQPKAYSVHVRIPSWCTHAMIDINGKELSSEIKRGHFVEINRTWKNKDTINLNMEMNWRFIDGTMTQYNRVALMRGPVVYCLSNEDNHLLDAKMVKQKIVIDPGSVTEPEPDTTFRPGGTKCSAVLWSLNGKPVKDTRLVFREFINPQGIKTYFDLPDSLSGKYGIPDEFMLKDEF